MKNLFLLFILALTITNAIAQGANFYTDKWKVYKVETIAKGGSMTSFHRDSTKNLIDYSQFEIKFLNDGTYKGSNLSGTSLPGTWSMNSARDTIVLDRKAYQITRWNADYLTMRTRKLQLKDTLGNLDTAFVDFTLYSLPDVLTSFDAQAFGTAVWKVFPNPVKEKVEVVLNDTYKGGVAELRLTNTYGQLLKTDRQEQGATSFVLDMKDIRPGIYTLEAIGADNKRIAVKKIVKE